MPAQPMFNPDFLNRFRQRFGNPSPSGQFPLNPGAPGAMGSGDGGMVPPHQFIGGPSPGGPRLLGPPIHVQPPSVPGELHTMSVASSLPTNPGTTPGAPSLFGGGSGGGTELPPTAGDDYGLGAGAYGPPAAQLPPGYSSGGGQSTVETPRDTTPLPPLPTYYEGDYNPDPADQPPGPSISNGGNGGALPPGGGPAGGGAAPGGSGWNFGGITDPQLAAAGKAYQLSINPSGTMNPYGGRAGVSGNNANTNRGFGATGLTTDSTDVTGSGGFGEASGFDDPMAEWRARGGGGTNLSGAKLLHHFRSGGVVPGAPSMHDTQPAMLRPGEVVLNPHQQRAVMVRPGMKQHLRPDEVRAIYAAHMRKG